MHFLYVCNEKCCIMSEMSDEICQVNPFPLHEKLAVKYTPVCINAWGHHLFSRRGGGLEFLSGTNYLFQPDSNFTTCLHKIVPDVNYLFYSESGRNYLFQKKFSPPPGD